MPGNADVLGPPARFPSGVNTVLPTDPLAMLGMPDPSAWVVFWDDFTQYAAADWTITTTELGAGSATEALGNLHGGILVITNDAADNDNDFFQWPAENFLLSSGKKAFFKARWKCSDATQSDLVIGLQITDTSPLAVSDGIYFHKDDGDTNIDFRLSKNSTDTDDAAVGTLADDTYVETAFYYNGVDAVEIYVDGSKVATETTLTNLPDDEPLCVSFGVQNGEAVAKVMSVDYIFAAVER